MSDQIDPAFKAAYRETQGQPVDAIPRTDATLMSFEKDGQRGCFDIVDGKFDYAGDLPVSDAARMLFETLALNISDWWLERAAAKPADADAAQQDGGLVERLLDPEYAGPLQHCRPYTEIDQLFREAATDLAEKDARIAELEAQSCDPDGCKAHIDAFMERAFKAERERDEARAECEGLRAALQNAEAILAAFVDSYDKRTGAYALGALASARERAWGAIVIEETGDAA